MSLFNTTLIGRIGNDPVTRQAGNSTVTEIQIAYENRRANNPVTEWVKVECWNGLGTDVVAKFARKGDRIAITANRFRTEAYTTQDGQPASKLVLTAVNCWVIIVVTNSQSSKTSNVKGQPCAVPFLFFDTC